MNQIEGKTKEHIAQRAASDANFVTLSQHHTLKEIIDPVFVAQGLGFSVYRKDFHDTNILAKIECTKKDTSISINLNCPWVRYRFLVAQCLGKYYIYNKGFNKNTKWESLIERFPDDEDNVLDVYGREFAKEFLMPYELIFKLAKNSHSKIALANHLMVPLLSLKTRLLDKNMNFNDVIHLSS